MIRRIQRVTQSASVRRLDAASPIGRTHRFAQSGPAPHTETVRDCRGRPTCLPFHPQPDQTTTIRRVQRVTQSAPVRRSCIASPIGRTHRFAPTGPAQYTETIRGCDYRGRPTCLPFPPQPDRTTMIRRIQQVTQSTSVQRLDAASPIGRTHRFAPTGPVPHPETIRDCRGRPTCLPFPRQPDRTTTIRRI